MRIPIKATARAPIKQAGFISATSDIQQNLNCNKQPVHTHGPVNDLGYARVAGPGLAKCGPFRALVVSFSAEHVPSMGRGEQPERLSSQAENPVIPVYGIR